MLNKQWLDSNWKGFFPKDGKINYKDRMTGVDLNVLNHIGTKYSSPPDCEFNLHPGSTANFQVWLLICLQFVKVDILCMLSLPRGRTLLMLCLWGNPKL